MSLLNLIYGMYHIFLEYSYNFIYNTCQKKSLEHHKNPNYSKIKNKVCIITGGNSGIGYATCETLALLEGHVIMACRSEEKAKLAINKIREKCQLNHVPDNNIEFMQLDLTSLKNINNFISNFKKKNLSLDLLICNAGIGNAPRTRKETQDGHEMMFQTNYLGHWLLSHQLAENELKRQKIKKENKELCILYLTSIAHLFSNFSDIEFKKNYNPFMMYAKTKLYAILNAKEMQRRFDKNKIDGYDNYAAAVHPGIIHTTLADALINESFMNSNQIVKFSNKNFFTPYLTLKPENSVESILFAATQPSSEIGGKYIAHGCVIQSSKASNNILYGAKLWELSKKLTNAKEEILIN